MPTAKIDTKIFDQCLQELLRQIGENASLIDQMLKPLDKIAVAAVVTSMLVGLRDTAVISNLTGANIQIVIDGFTDKLKLVQVRDAYGQNILISRKVEL